MKTPITSKRFTQLVEPLVGLRVSHTWRGYGSSIFLELGTLTWKGRKRQRKGEATVMIQWSWRVESVRTVRFGSWSSDKRLASGLARLKGLRIRRIRVEGRIPELEIELERGQWLHSFTTIEGQPEWTIFLEDGTWLRVATGRLVHEKTTRG